MQHGHAAVTFQFNVLTLRSVYLCQRQLINAADCSPFSDKCPNGLTICHAPANGLPHTVGLAVQLPCYTASGELLRCPSTIIFSVTKGGRFRQIEAVGRLAAAHNGGAFALCVVVIAAGYRRTILSRAD